MSTQQVTKRKVYKIEKGQRPCRFCVDKVKEIDYKDVDVLGRYLSERAKILGRRITKNCARHQRQLSLAIKRARFLALLPYTK